MLFTSLHWLVFLTSVFLIFHAAPRRQRKWLMLASSIYFYASWRAVYLFLIFGQLLVDWVCGFMLGRSRSRRKLIVAASVIINLGSLCVFKYWRLFGRTLHHLGIELPDLDVELPLAISFFTFESMSYTIDVYRRRLEPVRSPVHLALFITWFPHLIAGPIVRPAELVPQFANLPPLTRERWFSGLSLMMIGYGKKLLGADWLAPMVDSVFRDPSSYTGLEILVGVYAYAFQIYLDFSAYTDIARGASRWFGVELPENFNDPYLAGSITDFWRRWHMTLSHWLRDYLYIPLGGNRRGAARTYVNLMVTMLLGGLWHGANWTFLVWGGLHGIYLALERGLAFDGGSGWWRRVATFHLVCLAWIFFRAPSFEIAGQLLRGLAFGGWYLVEGRILPLVSTVAIIGCYWLVRPLRARLLEADPGDSFARQAGFVIGAAIYLVGLMALGASSSAFIYFRF